MQSKTRMAWLKGKERRKHPDWGSGRIKGSKLASAFSNNLK
jgi:hypothetical protein